VLLRIDIANCGNLPGVQVKYGKNDPIIANIKGREII
jgi:hypothetical protein